MPMRATTKIIKYMKILSYYIQIQNVTLLRDMVTLTLDLPNLGDFTQIWAAYGWDSM